MLTSLAQETPVLTDKLGMGLPGNHSRHCVGALFSTHLFHVLNPIRLTQFLRLLKIALNLQLWSFHLDTPR